MKFKYNCGDIVEHAKYGSGIVSSIGYLQVESTNCMMFYSLRDYAQTALNVFLALS